MKKATTDPSKRLDIYLRIARNGSITFTFLDSAGAAYDVSDLDFELFIKQNAGSRKDVISLLTSYAGFGLTFPTANQITATFTDTITEINEGEYYWELLLLDTSKTWLNGKAFFHNGEFDGVTQSDSIVIDNDGTDVTITINELVSPSGKFVGDFDPSAGIPTSGSGNNGAILKGDFWKASESGTIANLIPFTAFVAGDLIYANVNNASVVGDFFGNKGTGGSSGIGGSTGSVDNAILRADGTGGSTLQTSPLVISDNGDLDLGIDAVTAGANRTFEAKGSASNIGISFYTKGVGAFIASGSSSILEGSSSVSFSSPYTRVDNSSSALSGQFRISEAGENGSNYIGLKSPDAVTSTVTYTLPEAPSVSGYVLSSTTGGVMSWVDRGLITTVLDLTSDQIKTLGTVFTLVSAQGANTIVFVTYLSYVIDAGTPYATSTAIRTYYGNRDAHLVAGEDVLGTSVDLYYQSPPFSYGPSTTDPRNKSITLGTTDSVNPTTGTGTMRITVKYFIFNTVN